MPIEYKDPNTGASIFVPTDDERLSLEKQREVMDVIQELKSVNEYEVPVEKYEEYVIKDEGGAVLDWQPAITKAVESEPEGAILKFMGRDYNIAQNINVGNKVIGFSGKPTTRFVVNSKSITEPLLKFGFNSNESGKILLTSDAYKGTESISVQSTSGLSVGSYVLLLSNEPFSTAPDKSNRYRGEILRVKSVTSTTIDFYSRLQDDYRVASGGGYKRVNMVKGVSISDISFYNPNPNQTSTPFISVNNAINVKVRNVHMKGGDESGITFNNVVGGFIDTITCEDFTNNESNARYGYGINLFRATQNISISNSHFKRCRHGITVDNESNNYGVPRHIVISNCTSVDGSQAQFDTHQCGEFITFVNCSVQGSRVGADPYGTTYKNSVGYQLRSKNTRLIGCSVNGADDGIWIDAHAIGIEISNCSITDVKGVGIYLKENYTPSNGNIKDVMIKGTSITNAGDHGILINSSAKNVTIQGCQINGASKVLTGKNGIYIGSNVDDVRVMNNIIIDTADTPTMAYGVYIASGATNTKVFINYIRNTTSGRVQNLGTGTAITELDNNGNLIVPNIYVNGYTQIGKVASLPTPSSSYRGYRVRVEGGNGVADKSYECMKTGSDTYVWVQVATG